MAFLQWLKKHYDERGPALWLPLSFETIASVVLLFLMVLTCIDVVGRYIFASPVHGSTELTEIGLAVMVFAAMPVVTWRGCHIVVDLLDSILGPRTVKLFALLAAFVISLSLCAVGWRIWELAERSISRNVVTEFLGLPSGYVMIYIAVMSWATALGMLTYGVFRILRHDKN
ncbi:MAG: TRAP transporter small permease [Marinobacter alexandrii]